MPRRLLALLVASGVVCTSVGVGTLVHAAEHRLAEAVIDLPERWQVVARAMERELTLQDAEAKLTLDLFWWHPDEPILGYDDIVSHQEITVAGREALLVHSRFPETEMLQVVFAQPRSDGMKLIVSLEGIDADFSDGSPVLDAALTKLRFIEVERRPARRGGTPLAEPLEWVRHVDPIMGFSLDVPSGWQRRTRAYEAGRRFTLRAGNGEAIVSVGAVAGETIEAVAAGIERYRNAHYNDHILPDELGRSEGASIGAFDGVYLVARGETAGIDGHTIEFDLGRSWGWEGFGDGLGFWFAAVRAEASHPSLDAALGAVIDGFDPRTSGDGETQLAVEAALGVTCAFEERLDDGTDGHGGAHPTRALVAQQEGVTWSWLMRCGDEGQRVFGVRFAYDPSTATEAWFTPFYDRLLKANDAMPFVLVETRDRTVISVERDPDGTIGVDHRELPDVLD